MATLPRLFMVCGLALPAGLMVGCSEDDWHHHNHDYDYDRARTSSGRYDYDRGRVEVDPNASSKIPRDAEMVKEGHGGLSYTAHRDGTIYVYDADARAVIFDTRVRDGDRIHVRPDDNRITINGHDQTNIDLKSKHTFRIYFEPYGYRRYGY